MLVLSIGTGLVVGSKSEDLGRVNVSVRNEKAMPPMRLGQTDPIVAGHNAITSALVNAGYSPLNIAISGDTGRYTINGNIKYVEWKLNGAGEILYFKSFVEGVLAIDVQYSYSLDGILDSLVVTEVGQTPMLVAEVERDSEGVITGHWNYYNNIYTPISVGPQPNMNVAQTYQECMQNCNYTGTQCTNNARLAAALSCQSALGHAGVIVVGGTVVGTLITPGPGTAAGFLAGVLAGVLTLSVELSVIHAQLEYDLKNCRQDYDRCVAACKLLRTKKPDQTTQMTVVF